MRATASFRLSKQTKRIMATIVDPIKQSEYKRAMINAELASLIQPRREKSKNNIKTEE
jgi:hypothetical protein